MTKQPAITVLMPAYNAGRYIAEAIQSVLSQTFTDFELLIINDGSTDNTGEIISSFDDPRIRVINQVNQGVAAALNIGLLQARAPYIMRCDADDMSHPWRFQVQYDFMMAHPEYVYVGASVDYIDETGAPIFTYYPSAFTDAAIQRSWHKENNFIHASVVYLKEAAIASGGYNTHAYILEDHLLWLHIKDKGKSYNIAQPLLKVRFNTGSLTISGKHLGSRYARIKKTVFEKGVITEAEGKELMAIMRTKNNKRIREIAYHTLLAKKYLWNNHQPQKARVHLRKALSIEQGNIKNRSLLLLSYLPKSCIRKLYNWFSVLK